MKKSAKKATTVAIALLVVIFVVVVNVFVSKIVSTYNWKFDMTNSHLYSISDETKELMQQVDKEVNIFYIAKKDNTIIEFTEMLDKYAQCNKLIHVRHIDPSVDLLWIDEYTEKGVTLALNTVIVECGENRRIMNIADMYQFSMDGSLTMFNGEALVTSAVMNVISEQSNTAVLLMGHGEDTPTELENLIVSYGYKLSGLVLAKEVPEQVGTILIAGPQKDFSESELAYLDSFLARGGSIMYFRNPQVAALPNLDNFLASWGIRFNYQVVLDSSYCIDSNPMYVIANYLDHPINEYFKTHNYYVVTPVASPIVDDFSNSIGAGVSIVLASSDYAYGRDLNDLESSTEKKTTDDNGPFVLAVAAERKYKQTDGSTVTGRIFAMGSNRFYQDKMITSSSIGNAIFCGEVLGWSSESKAQTFSIAGKQVGAEPLNVTASQIRIFAILLIGVIPFLIIAYGVVVVIQRRYL